MTDYKKLVDDLRDIGKTMFALGTTHISMGNVSISLAYDKGWGQTANDAAAAIEALLKENKELIEDHPEMVEADGHWEWRKPNGEVLMPKRGEWIRVQEVDIPGEMHPVAFKCMCSMCRNEYLFPRIPQYCPNCGSRNTEKKEVQE